jgi:hypothetical protein
MTLSTDYSDKVSDGPNKIASCAAVCSEARAHKGWHLDSHWNEVDRSITHWTWRGGIMPRQVSTSIKLGRVGKGITFSFIICSMFTYLWLGVAAAAQCTPEQILALLDKGFTKDEVRQLCASAGTPAGPKQGAVPQPERSPTGDVRTEGATDFPGLWSVQHTTTYDSFANSITSDPDLQYLTRMT